MNRIRIGRLRKGMQELAKYEAKARSLAKTHKSLKDMFDRLALMIGNLREEGAKLMMEVEKEDGIHGG